MWRAGDVIGRDDDAQRLRVRPLDGRGFAARVRADGARRAPAPTCEFGAAEVLPRNVFGQDDVGFERVDATLSLPARLSPPSRRTKLRPFPLSPSENEVCR